MGILFTIPLTEQTGDYHWERHKAILECIGIDVAKRYCQVAILAGDSTSSDPEEHRLSTDREKLEGFAVEHAAATAAIEDVDIALGVDFSLQLHAEDGRFALTYTLTPRMEE